MSNLSEDSTPVDKVKKGCYLMVDCEDLGKVKCSSEICMPGSPFSDMTSISSTQLESHVKAEVLQVGGDRCYVHFLEHNKRLDRWVNFEKLDFESLEYPKPLEDDHNQGKSLRNTPAPKKRRRTCKKQTARRTTPRLNPEAASNSSTTDKPPNSSERTHASSRCSDDKISQIKNIEMIQLGEHFIKPWYFSPYPKELSTWEVVYICEFCLAFRRTESALTRHRQKCKYFHPPGCEIYRCDDISFFEVDGKSHVEYSHNLCLLAKLFLDHKTLYYDTDPFLFYILTRTDRKGSHIVGYFSKERQSKQDYNVACILVLPPYQKMGYGRILIEFSYELTKREGKQGSPEKPLSDLGLLSYFSYWSDAVLSILLAAGDKRPNQEARITTQEICEKTGMKKDDVIYILQQLELLYYDRGDICILLDEELIKRHENRVASHRLSIRQDCFFGKWKRD